MNEAESLSEAVGNLKKITSESILKMFIDCFESNNMSKLAWVHPKFQTLEKYMKTFGKAYDGTIALFDEIAEELKQEEYFELTKLESNNYVDWLEKNLNRLCDQAVMNYFYCKEQLKKKIDYHEIADKIYQELFEAGLNHDCEDE